MKAKRKVPIMRTTVTISKILMLACVGMLLMPTLASAQEHEFKGKIAKTYEESVEDWPPEHVFTGEEPSVLLILLDDVGFSQLGSYGGLTETPNLDKLAAEGLRYNNFHTTALCSPTRGAILAGRNHHSIGLGSHAVSAMGFPGYNGRVSMHAQEVTKTAQQHGWGTYAIGKWDHTPGYNVHQAGPFTYWPTNDGFDHTYLFMAADANNFTPVMYAGHEPVEPALGNPDYHLSEDMADKAIYYLTGQVSINPDKPFFMFWAPGAMHAPHHAPQEYIDKYKGKFDMGWDRAREVIFEKQKRMGIIPKDAVLTARVDDIPAWSELPAEERKLYARQMEAFAGQLDHVDAQIGRMIETLERLGKLDNTLIIVTSDNGASGEGGLSGTHNEMLVVNGTNRTSVEENLKRIDVWGSEATNNHYHAGWTWAGNTPFKYFKQIVHRGGQADPLIIHWPKGIEDKGAIREQYAHVIDIGVTVMDVFGTKPAEVIDGYKQLPFDGISMAYTFNDAEAKSQRTRQYYELWGNRAMYLDGWKAVTIHGNRMPWVMGGTFPFEDDVWELYHVAEDYSESNDLAKKHPEKLKELIAEWDKEAWKYNVYPLYDDVTARIADVNKRYTPQRKTFNFYTPGAIRIPEAYSPPVKNRNHTMIGELDLPSGSTSGVILAQGGIYGGYALYLVNGELRYAYNAFDENRYTVKASKKLPKGKAVVKAVYKVGEPNGKGPDSGTGSVTLFINGEKVGEGKVERTHPGLFSLNETFDVGVDMGTPVSKDYTRTKGNELRDHVTKVIVTIDD